MNKSKSKTVFNSILDHFGKEKLIILLPKAKVLTLAIKKVDITIIGTNGYWSACKSKRA